MKRLSLGRLQVYIEPRDIWVGCYVSTDAVYVCPLPVVVLRWQRGVKVAPDGRPAEMFRRVDFELDDDEVIDVDADWPKRGGYSGGKPASEVGPPPTTPSGPPPPSASHLQSIPDPYPSFGVWRTAEDDAKLDATLAEITRGEQAALTPRFMVLCPACGNKRCPRAASESNDCTGSNEPGQPGSNYP